MKTKTIFTLSVVFTFAMFPGLKAYGGDISTTASGGNTAQTDNFGVQLGVPTTEMPAQAAKLVAAAKAGQRETATKAVVIQALTQRPTIAAALVGAIAQSSPDMAAVAAVTAVGQQPTQIGQIIMAAVSAAPPQAGKIVFAICQKFPTRFNYVAMVATRAAPQSGREILVAVASAVPAVKPYIDQSHATTVAGIISDVQYSVAAAAQSANTTPEVTLALASPDPANSAFAYTPISQLPPPTVGAPFAAPPPGTKPIIVPPWDIVIVPPGPPIPNPGPFPPPYYGP
jgi:hypothetical protein